MLAWGVICTLMGIVQNYSGLLATRALLGLAVSVEATSFSVNPVASMRLF